MRKVSILCTVLCVGFLVGGCSLSGREDFVSSEDIESTEDSGSTGGSLENLEPESPQSVIESFLESVGGSILEYGDPPNIGDMFYDFSADGIELNLSKIQATNDQSEVTSAWTNTFEIAEDSVVKNADGGYTAYYYNVAPAWYSYTYVIVTVTADKTVYVVGYKEDAIKED